MLIERFLLATWEMLQLSSFWLLVGFLLSGLFHILIPESFVRKLLSRPGRRSVILASVIGMPVPVCSCSVIPLAASLRGSGASRGATASFLISAPESGVDAFFVSYSLLGLPLTLIRIVAAFLAAFFAGTIIDRQQHEDSDLNNRSAVKADCCHEEQHSVRNDACNGDYHGTKIDSPSKLVTALRYGFGDIASDLAPALAIGYLIAGFISAIIPANWFATVGLPPLVTSVLMLFVSLPIYVCATSSTPVAAALLAAGINPGAAVVFLLAGPGTNVTTIAAVKSLLGARALFPYIVSIAAVALAVGTLTDIILVPSLGSGVLRNTNTSGHEHLTQSALSTLSSIAVIGLTLFHLAKRFRMPNTA